MILLSVIPAVCKRESSLDIPGFRVKHGMTTKKWFLIVAMILIVTSSSFAADNPVWVESDGEAVMGEIETQKEVKERAKIDAQNKAVQKAVGAFIRSHTLVSNAQLAEDLVYASVRGKIERSNVIKEGWDAKDRNLYRVKLKALVKPVYPEKGEGISVKLSLSKTVLKEGDEVKIFFRQTETVMSTSFLLLRTAL